ncbi:methyltransferase domain-containing protein [Streptomyces sp. B1866]|uniref:TRM11 family SAM-dependent methyltransferase n=1 Tax=Streptomyces sp. B1866 TaxID=3075431 RepID=UPI002898B6F7|nr:methyltransferase domain-containing protein [Streptomyces sp. B1866]
MAAEILRRGLGAVTGLGHREVHYRPSGAVPETGADCPRTADDVFLLAARMPDPGPGRADLARLAGLAARADPGGRDGRSGRDGRGVTGVEVSASFLGRRAFNRYDAEDAVGHALAARLGVPYHARRGGAAPPPGHSGWRLTLDGTWATLMRRLTGRPLHRRAYKGRTIPGTLHPPVAAAMTLLADVRPGHRVLDPCCGAGTLLIEAAHVCPDARFDGFDLDADALRAARTNAADAFSSAVPAPASVSVRRGDAGELPLADGSVDRLLCNPPWGGQVSPRGLLAERPARWWAELRRVLAPDGAAVVLLPDAADLATAIARGFTPVHVQQIRLSGAQPCVVRLTATPRAGRSQAGRPRSGSGRPGPG